jgi:hypothetical protein
VAGARGAAVAQRVHAALWALIVDAKSRKRNPDGTLVSAPPHQHHAFFRSFDFFDFFRFITLPSQR